MGDRFGFDGAVAGAPRRVGATLTACAECDTVAVTDTGASATGDFVDAIVARDLLGARERLGADIDFRAMTPARAWEADDPAGVETVLRAWLEHPEREVQRIDAIEPSSLEDTLRVGWRVYGQGAEGPFVFEQQAYAREHEGQIVWLRVMCTGPRPIGALS
jgi:hypothetical protein